MTITPKLLASGSGNYSAALTDVYTVPADTTVIVKTISIDNLTVGASYVAIERPGEDPVYIYSAPDTEQVYQYNSVLVLHTGDRVKVKGGIGVAAPAGYLHYTISGVEISPSGGGELTTTAGA